MTMTLQIDVQWRSEVFMIGGVGIDINAYLSACVIVVQVHQRPGRDVRLLDLLPGVDEGLSKGASVGDVVRAASPLEPVG